MSTELEKDVAAALRFRAGEVPDSPCPPLGVARVATKPARRSWLVPVAAAAAAVVGLAGAAVALLPGTGDDEQQVTTAAPTEVYYSRILTDFGSTISEFELWQGQGRTDAWQQKGHGGNTIKDGRVVPNDSVRLNYPEKGECYPAPNTSDKRCTAPGAWFNPTPDFLAGAPRDPQVIAQQLHDEAVAEEERRTAPGGDYTATDDTFNAANLAFLELNYLRQVLAANGMPDDLSASLQQVIAAMPDIQVTKGMANLLGERGTGYSLPNNKDQMITVIFADDGDYLGAPDQAVVHGVAPGLGQPPSRLFD